jgi:hypothetical protein
MERRFLPPVILALVARIHERCSRRCRTRDVDDRDECGHYVFRREAPPTALSP